MGLTDTKKVLCLNVSVLLVSFVGLAVLAGCQAGRLPPSNPSRGAYHKVQRGQTLWGIAQQYGVDMTALARVNKLSDANVLHIGQRLYIPGVTRQRQVGSQCPCEPQGKTRTRKSRATKRLKTTVRSPIFIWPVQGTVTRGFKQSGKHRHDGIDIAAPKGTPILAVADGKVMYSDWGPGGYGRLVIIRHTANMVTVYAHNHQNLVKVGQKIRRADRIATVGRSGRATGYHLHFEVRRKTVPVPPTNYLARNRQLVQLSHR